MEEIKLRYISESLQYGERIDRLPDSLDKTMLAETNACLRDFACMEDWINADRTRNTVRIKLLEAIIEQHRPVAEFEDRVKLPSLEERRDILYDLMRQADGH